MESYSVVTVFLLRHQPDRVLLGRRSASVRTYRGAWGAISGYLEGDPEQQARREIVEETGLTGEDVLLVRAGEPLTVVDESTSVCWRVHPFLFEALRPEAVRTDRKHSEFTWLAPEEIGGLETVPMLAEALGSVYP